MKVVPRRLAGPGNPRRVWSALKRRDWRPVDWHTEAQGTRWVSPGFDLAVTTPGQDGHADWTISAHPDGPLHPPRWKAALAVSTPSEIVADVLSHLLQLRARDRRAALEGPHHLQGFFASITNAGWEQVLTDDGWAHLHSPDAGIKRIEIWHRVPHSWSSSGEDDGATTISIGGAIGQETAPHLWRAVFSRRTPEHLVAAVMRAAVSPKAARRRAGELPDYLRAAVTTSGPAPDPRPAGSFAPDDPAAASQLLHDTWDDVFEDEIGNVQLRRPCGQVSVLDTPEDRHDVAWSSRWSITVEGDEPPARFGKAQRVSWKAQFTAHTPPTVVAAVTAGVHESLRDLDRHGLLGAFEIGPGPWPAPNRSYRPDPVSGSRDPVLAHARLRLQGWERSDRPRATASRSPGGTIELWSVAHHDPSSLDVVPGRSSWTLDGGQPPALWSATFTVDTPTHLVLAAAREAAHLTEPHAAKAGAPARIQRAVDRTRAAQSAKPNHSRLTTRSASPRNTDPAAAPSSPPAGPRRRR